MKNSIIFVALAMALVFSCSGPVSDWKSAPLSPATDISQMKAQIKACPGEWAAAFKYLSETDLGTAPLGRYDITENTYAIVQEYDSHTEGQYEAHRKYIDIQVVISGDEYIYVSPLDKAFNLTHAYNEAEGDFVFYADADGAQAVSANPENWVVLFPNEAHKPGMAISEPAPIRKVVVKIPFAE